MPQRESEYAVPFVREELDHQSMHFSDAAIQSRMQLREPDALALEYTRTMMGFVLFQPVQAHAAMIGLGGGSIAKLLHRRLPHTDLTVVEINPHVIALRARFRVPHDGPRFRVVQDDGAHFVATTPQRFDVLLIDAFDADGMPETLGTRRFYDDCADVLRPGGVLAVNLHAGHPHFPVYLDRLGAAFDGRLLRVDDHDGTNSVVFARRGQALTPSPRAVPAGTLAPDALARIEHAMRQQRAAED
ncbi:MAG: fused MFS/spermidine synthase [Burkholderiales bacterium]